MVLAETLFKLIKQDHDLLIDLSQKGADPVKIPVHNVIIYFFVCNDKESIKFV